MGGGIEYFYWSSHCSTQKTRSLKVPESLFLLFLFLLDFSFPPRKQGEEERSERDFIRRRRPCHALDREGGGFFVSKKGSEGFSQQKIFLSFENDRWK